MSQAWFQKQKKVFIAYADETNENQFLVRKGKQYFHLSSQKEIKRLSQQEAYHIFRMVSSGDLAFRGIGSFENMQKRSAV